MTEPPVSYDYSEDTVNVFANSASIEMKLFNVLLNSTDETLNYPRHQYAETIWRLLASETPECLGLAVPERNVRLGMLWTGENGTSTGHKVFIQPYQADAFTWATTFLCIYVDQFIPTTLREGKVIIAVDCVANVNNGTIYDPYSKKDPTYNVNDAAGGQQTVYYQNRATLLAKSVIGLFNGLNLDGSGYLAFAKEEPLGSKECGAKEQMYDNKQFYGYTVKFSLPISKLDDGFIIDSN
jgi:hypothetical protein